VNNEAFALQIYRDKSMQQAGYSLAFQRKQFSEHTIRVTLIAGKRTVRRGAYPYVSLGWPLLVEVKRRSVNEVAA
jgi:hypothetical protein